MYFSLILPEPGQERVAARAHLTDPYAEHQWLWRWFPAEAGTARDFIYRRREADGIPRYYVVSKRHPAQPQPGWSLQCRPYDPELAKGERLAFDLRANAVVSRPADGKGRRHDVVMDEKRRLLQERGLEQWSRWDRSERPPLYEIVHAAGYRWLAQRAEACGFQLDEAQLRADAYVQHRIKGAVKFTSIDFSGELLVTDPEKLKAALLKGIGHAKAFGCGLLLVRRLV
ncbi:MAG: type I-E CRISPR-associated protein Cas6/Cse3/CasE [Aquabacterium sp.]|nr:type I-E CRISPR-associated protein Cas6/Cse3/CasE [Aquabacterium sp.]